MRTPSDPLKDVSAPLSIRTPAHSSVQIPTCRALPKPNTGCKDCCPGEVPSQFAVISWTQGWGTKKRPHTAQTLVWSTVDMHPFPSATQVSRGKLRPRELKECAQTHKSAERKSQGLILTEPTPAPKFLSTGPSRLCWGSVQGHHVDPRV